MRNAVGSGWEGIPGVTLEVLPYTVNNGTDFHLAVRLGELLRDAPDAVAIVSRDGDFAALLHSIRQQFHLPAICLVPTNDNSPIARLAQASSLCIVLPGNRAQGSRSHEGQGAKGPPSTGGGSQASADVSLPAEPRTEAVDTLQDVPLPRVQRQLFKLKKQEIREGRSGRLSVTGVVYRDVSACEGPEEVEDADEPDEVPEGDDSP